MRQTIIIGWGPAGYTAGIYAGRANLDPLLIASSVEAGGELVKTTEVENFPGFPDGILGPDLMVKIQAQAERFGTEVVLDDVVDLQLDGDVKLVTLGNGEVHEALSVIFATGFAYRKLGIPDEERLSGHGVSWCATCDGFFFHNKTIAVVGGGASAMEEATFLTRFADKVYVIHRASTLRASKTMQNRAFDNLTTEFMVNKIVERIYGHEKIVGVRLRDTLDGSETTLDLEGVFIAIGANPHTPRPRQARLQLRRDHRSPGTQLAHQRPRRFRRRRSARCGTLPRLTSHDGPRAGRCHPVARTRK